MKGFPVYPRKAAQKTSVVHATFNLWWHAIQAKITPMETGFGQAASPMLFGFAWRCASTRSELRSGVFLASASGHKSVTRTILDQSERDEDCRVSSDLEAFSQLEATCIVYV